VYARITAKIVAALEDGVRPWVRPWNAEHAAGRIMRPLRHNGQPYTGINILSLWASASAQGFAAPIWMTYRQAVELGANIRKGEKGSPVLYANSLTRNETDTASGVAVARDIHFPLLTNARISRPGSRVRSTAWLRLFDRSPHVSFLDVADAEHPESWCEPVSAPLPNRSHARILSPATIQSP
jgi:hypothetical protein